MDKWGRAELTLSAFLQKILHQNCNYFRRMFALIRCLKCRSSIFRENTFSRFVLKISQFLLNDKLIDWLKQQLLRCAKNWLQKSSKCVNVKYYYFNGTQKCSFCIPKIWSVTYSLVCTSRKWLILKVSLLWHSSTWVRSSVQEFCIRSAMLNFCVIWLGVENEKVVNRCGLAR